MGCGDAPNRMSVEEFCDTYYDRVVGFAVRAFGRDEAHDVAHDALERALASYSSLDPERDAWPWLATIVRNAGRESLRRKRALPLDAATEVATPDAAFDVVAAEEELRTLAAALARVPRADRDVLLMRVRDELPFAEMSRRTGRSSGALRVQALRARQRLAEEFARLGGTAYGLSVVVSAKAERLKERLAGLAAAWPSAAQLAAAVVVCGGLATGAAPAAPAVAAAPERVATDGARQKLRPVAAPRARLAMRAAPPRAARPASANRLSPAEPAKGARPPRGPHPDEHRVAQVETPVGTAEVNDRGRRGSPGVACALPAPLC